MTPGPPIPEARSAPLLEVKHLKKFFPIQKGFSRRVVAEVRAVDDVSFEVREGETLGLVGESGCGKTTTARCILRAMAPSSGQIFFRTRQGAVVDLAQLSRKELRPLRPEIQMVFQDPFGSLNPRMTLLDNVGEPLLVNGLRDRRARRDRVAELLRLVGMRPEYMYRFPHAFSGGQRQRIGIARALATEPRLVVADEPVSALDVSVQAQVLNLLLELQQRLHLTYLLVAHDLGVVRHVSNRIAVMYLGKLVELSPAEELYQRPIMPYTEALLSAVPIPDPDLAHARERIVLQGDVPSPINPPSGCRFHPRCRYMTDICQEVEPPLTSYGNGHLAACHHPLNVDKETLARATVSDRYTPAEADEAAKPQSPGKQESHPIPESG